MKQKIYKVISILLVLVWMLLMFNFSSEVSYESSATSGNTIRWVIKLVDSNITSNRLEELVEIWQPIVRKLAHLTLYVIGGILITNVIEQYKEKIKYTETLAFLIGLAYAVSDEFHQLFVPGRSGELKDVFIDTVGVVIGMCLMYIIFQSMKLIEGNNERV